MYLALSKNRDSGDLEDRLVMADQHKTSRLRNFSAHRQKGLGLSGIMDKEDMHKIVYDDGTTYMGELSGERKHGKGRLVDHKGDVYEGEFFNDNIEGYGIFKGADGTEYEGEWKFGQQHGQGKELWPDNSYYEGGYKNGLKHGKGKYFWADGSFYEGEWIAGNIDGFVSLLGCV